MKKQKTKYKQTEIGMIPEDWEILTIGFKCKIKNGKTNTQDAVKNGKYPLFDRSSQVKKSNKFLFDCEAVIIPGEGKTFIPKYFFGKFDLHQRAYAIWSENKEISIKYIYYWIIKNIRYLESIAVGSTVKSLRLNHLKNFPLALPKTFQEQKAIAKILSDIDAKIKLNNQMNKTLEEIGQAIFKHWFIDFEFPNEEGKPYKSSGGEMVYNEELGKEIPKGWKVKRLLECGVFKNGVNYLRDEKGDEEFYIVNVRDIVKNKFLLKEYLDKIKLNSNKGKKYLLKKGDILIARSANPGDASLILGNLERTIYSGFSICYRLNKPTNYIFFFLLFKKIKKDLLRFSIGTTLKSINQEFLKNIKICLPPNRLIKKFNIISEDIIIKIYYNLIENYNLSMIRDSLLPKLMTGKIRVPLEVKK